MHVVTIT